MAYRGFTCMAAVALLAGVSHAATINLNYTGNAVPYSTNTSGTSTGSFYQLTNTATGTSAVPGFTLSVGDVVTGSIIFNAPVIVPVAGQYSGISATLISNSGGSPINYNLTIDAYSGGQKVTPTNAFPIKGTSGFLGVGYSDFAALTPAYAFDSIMYSATITGFGPFGNPTAGPQTDTLATGSSYFSVDTYAPAAVAGVPEPASWATMVGGFGLVGSAMRRRKLAVAFA